MSYFNFYISFIMRLNSKLKSGSFSHTIIIDRIAKNNVFLARAHKLIHLSLPVMSPLVSYAVIDLYTYLFLVCVSHHPMLLYNFQLSSLLVRCDYMPLADFYTHKPIIVLCSHCIDILVYSSEDLYSVRRSIKAWNLYIAETHICIRVEVSERIIKR